MQNYSKNLPHKLPHYAAQRRWDLRMKLSTNFSSSMPSVESFFGLMASGLHAGARW